MSAIEMVAVVAWPLAIVGVILFIRAWYLEVKFGQRRWPLIFGAALLFFVPLLILAAHPNDSHITAAAMEGFPTFAGLLFCSMVIGALAASRQRGATKFFSTSKKARLGLVAFAVAGPLCVAYGVRNLSGDYLLPRIRVEGVIQEVFKTHGRRTGWYYHLRIDGRRYSTSADVLDGVRAGDRVAAEVGAGSGRIFWIAPLPAGANHSALVQ